MTKYFCDMCKSKLADGVAPIRMQIEQKMHEFCNECWVSLRNLLEGTGIPVVTQPFSGPYMVPNTVPAMPDLWKDMIGNSGLPNGIQITYGSNSNSSISQPESSNLEAPGFKGILADLYVEPGSSLAEAIKAHFVKA